MKINCTTSIPKLKLKSKNNTFTERLPKFKRNYGKILSKTKIKFLYQNNTTVYMIPSYLASYITK